MEDILKDISYDPHILRTLESFEYEVIPNVIPESLPLLDELRKVHPDPGIYENLDILFIQHHLGPFTSRLKAMREDGLDMNRTWFVDIPYSTCINALNVAHQGCPDNHTVQLFNDPLGDYAETQLARVLILLRELAFEKHGRLLVVDDGAYFLRALQLLHNTRPDISKRFKNTRIVEQTTRGHRVVEKSIELVRELGLSVVSIARCNTKIQLESPFVGAAVSRAINRAIQRNDGLTSDFQRGVVLGFGPVGSAVTRMLRLTYPEMSLEVVEPDIRKFPGIEAEKAVPHRELPDRSDSDNGYNLVAGCTGYNSFKLHQRKLLADNAILASGSSAAVEFNRKGFIELADAYPDDEIAVLNREQVKGNIHSTISIAHEGGMRMHFLNAGFPVNFDGLMECLPNRMIQATHCLLYLAGRQVLRQEAPGVNRFDEKMDAWLLKTAPGYLDLKC